MVLALIIATWCASIIAYPATLVEAYICIHHDSFISSLCWVILKSMKDSILLVIYRALPLMWGKDPKEDKTKDPKRGQNKRSEEDKWEINRKRQWGHKNK